MMFYSMANISENFHKKKFCEFEFWTSLNAEFVRKN